jgi:hypothetical protein
LSEIERTNGLRTYPFVEPGAETNELLLREEIHQAEGLNDYAEVITRHMGDA